MSLDTFFQDPKNVYAFTSVSNSIASVFAGGAEKALYNVKAYASEVAAKQAVSEAEYATLKLMQQWNDISASNAVAAAASGRSFNSGSLVNLDRINQQKLNWDIDYIEKSGEMGKAAKIADASGYRAAGDMAQTSATTKGLLGLADTYTKYKQIG